MYIDGMLGFLLGIFLIWGGYAVSVVICTTIADIIENKEKQGAKMAEIIRKYRDKYNNLVTEYKCSVCGEPTLRYRSVGDRRALCIFCIKREENERTEKRKQDIYAKGYADAIEEMKETKIDVLKWIIKRQEEGYGTTNGELLDYIYDHKLKERDK